MSDGPASRRLVRPLDGLFRAGIAGDLSDGELLDRFLRDPDGVGEAAFAALVERHGAMLLRVCREALNDLDAAEDALQATFLVLARQAGSIRKRTSVSSWLFGVARRAAARIRMEETRRRRYESRSAERSSALAAARQLPADPDPYPELHAEIERLPEDYRLPVLLCYFEGLSHEQAASRLRWPVGTVKTRLSRARDRLRSRLERPFLLVLPASPPGPGFPTDIPERLIQTITRAACRYATSGLPGAVTSSTVLAVTQEVLRAMLIHQLKSLAVVSGLLLVGLGGLVAAQQATSKGRAGQPDAAVVEAGDAGSILRLPGGTAAGPSDSPDVLRLHASTDYDPATVSTVRMPFDGRVDKVLIDLGSVVKRGDPLLEVYSSDLAAAKSDYEVASSQWVHDKKIYDYKKPLAESNTLPKRELIDAESNEAQSRLKMKLARDKLLIYGLTEAEIDAVKDEDGTQRARMILRARADGVLIKRDVVPGNFYDRRDTLLTIARLDHLWVRARVPEPDFPKIQVGQKLAVIFPSGNQCIEGTVDFIDPRLDPETHTFMLRATIPNPNGRYKAGSLVRVELKTEPRLDRHDETRTAGEPPLGATVEDRLSALERKIDRLIGENEERSARARILQRLDVLDQKLDQLLDARKAKSP